MSLDRKDLQGLPANVSKRLITEVNAALAAAGLDGAVAVHRVRGVVAANVANLAVFTVAGNDGLTYAEGERVALIAQSTGAQDGIYEVGAVAGGEAALTRVDDWALAAVIKTGSIIVVDAGTVYANRMLMVTNAGDVTVGTTDPTFSSFMPADLGGAIQKLTLTATHATITEAAAFEVVAIGTLPANSRVLAVEMHTYTPFTGGTISDFTVDVGTTGDVDALIDGANLFAAAVDGQPATQTRGVNPQKPFLAGATINARFDCGSDDVADATAGAVTIDVLYVVLP